MAKGKFIQTNFTGGEWSPLLEGRVDLDKYPNSLYKLENFLIYPHGPAQLRPGFRYIHPTKDNGVARLIPFEFSTELNYLLEFGDLYIRFYKDQNIVTQTAQNITNITKANPAVVTYSGADTYANGDRVIISGVLGMTEVNNREFTVANVNVGANTFELSGVNSLSYTTYISGGTIAEIYEIVSPYAAADLDFIQIQHSQIEPDVFYLFHPDYITRKITRGGDLSWTISIVNFDPPATVEDTIIPAATLTLNATSGNYVTFISSVSLFIPGDVGRIIVSGAGRASIVDRLSDYIVICAIIDQFASVGPIASGSWEMQGSPNGTITPSIKSPVGAIVTLPSTAGAETFTELLEAGVNHWAASGLGTNEYYLKNTAPFYASVQPHKVYLNSVDTGAPMTLGTLTASKHGWGDNDTLGYNTIYVRLSDGTDPDSKSSVSIPDNDYVKRSTVIATVGLYRSTDIGKYIAINSGFVRLTQYDSGEQMKGIILKELSVVTATVDWTLRSSVWNADNGYPADGTCYENRLELGGSDAYPNTIWGSVVGEYENFIPGADDSDSTSFTLTGKKVSKIFWLEPKDVLLAGTSNGPHRLGSEDATTPLTPTNIFARQKGTVKCAYIPPITINESILYVQEGGKKIRELTYNWESNSYVAPDLTRLAEHITRSGIVEMAYQQEPLSIVWCRTVDGELIGMTYLREEEVIGWQRYPIDGTVESIATIPGDGYDEIWAIINRTINGQTVRYIEMMEAVFTDTDAEFQANLGLNAFFVDSGLTYNGVSTSTISGLWHLNGETVAILADCGIQTNKVVSNGSITLDSAASVVHIGLPYTAKLQQMRLETQLPDGTAQGRVKRTPEVTIRVYNSGTFKIGRDENHLDVVSFGVESPPSLFTGDKKVSYEGTFGTEDRLMIVQDKPLPLTIVAIIKEVAISP